MIADETEVRLRALLRAAWARAAAAAERDSGWVPRDDRDAILYTAALALEPLIPSMVPVHLAANAEDHEDFARLIGAGFRAGGPRWFGVRLRWCEFHHAASRRSPNSFSS